MTTLLPNRSRAPIFGQFGTAFSSGLRILIAVLAIAAWAPDARAGTGSADAASSNTAAESGKGVDMLGPSSVSGQLHDDEERRPPLVSVEPLDQSEGALKSGRKSLRERIGLTLSGDYNSLFQSATESLGEDSAAGGVFRIFGNWSWPGEPWDNPGSLTFKVENRHSYTEIAPQQLGGQLGYSALTAISWSDAGWLLSNLYWYQQLFDNRFAFAAGIVDTTDYVDVYGLVNPWTDYMNSVFLNSPTIPFPGQGLGVAVRRNIASNLYVLAGFANANGDPTKPLKDFDTFFTEGEYFKHLEIGWRGSWERRVEDNLHLTVWQTDARSDAGISGGWGGALSANRLFGDRWLPFVRAGWADGGGGVPLTATISTGIGLYLRDRADLLALGFSWGHPSEETLGSGLRDEGTMELLYRLQLVPRLAITPDVQLLIHPARNPDADLIAVFGVRARLAL